MADDWQDKTEEATARKFADAKKKGNVAKSQDLSTGFMLFIGIGFIYLFSTYFFDKLTGLIIGIFHNLMEPFDHPESIVKWFRFGIKEFLLLVGPILLCLAFVGIFSNILQSGWVLTLEQMKPKLEKLNPFDPKNLKKFFDSRAIMKTLFGVLKIGIVAAVLAFFVTRALPQISRMMESNPRQMYIFLFWQIFLMAIVVSLIFIFIGLIDFIYQKNKHKKDLKMTKQEVKDESKQSEGDPLVKAKIRSTMISFMQSRMKANVEHADVVVANPIHYAIAIKYDAEKMAAPMCVAKGARKLAEAIKELAKKHDVPIVENPPLAQGLYKTVEVGMYIPPDFYHTVAEVLAYVYKLNQLQKGVDQT